MSYTGEDFFVKRVNENGYIVSAAKKGKYKAFWAGVGFGFSDDNELGEFEQELEVTKPAGVKRLFVHIIDENKRYYVACERVLRRGGFTNLRDLGGYNTADKKCFVKPGVIFRSDALIYGGEAGIEFLRDVGVKYVLDFRGKQEAERKPDLPVHGAHYDLAPAATLRQTDKGFTMEEFFAQSSEEFWQKQNMFNDSYADMPFASAAYKKMFRALLEERVPMLFHCTAGKDRTGIGAALILMVLGVPRETIIADYMLSVSAREQSNKELFAKYNEYLTDDDIKERYWEILNVRQVFIETSMTAIDQRYPNPQDYFEQELELDAADIEKLKRIYLIEH
ncbi:MAG: tyrosine-protein phosphatase [Oscillospiraceae bacterium]